MTIENKISYIANYPSLDWSMGWGFQQYSADDILSIRLKQKGFINKNLFTKFSKLNVNFYNHLWRDENLNSDSILLINLVYKILKAHENKSTIL